MNCFQRADMLKGFFIYASERFICNRKDLVYKLSDTRHSHLAEVFELLNFKSVSEIGSRLPVCSSLFKE